MKRIGHVCLGLLACSLALAEDETVTAVIAVEHCQAGDLAARLTPPRYPDPRTGADVQLPEGVQSVTGLNFARAILAQGTAAGIAELRKLIALLDQPSQTIRVKARIITAAQGNAEKYGMSWAPAAMNRYAAGNFDTLVTAFIRDNAAKIISLPEVVLHNGEKVTLRWQQPETIEAPAGWQIDAPLMVNNAIDVTVRITGTPPNESLALEITPRTNHVYGFAESQPTGAATILTAPEVVNDNLVTIRVPNGGQVMVDGLQTGHETPAIERILWLKATVLKDGEDDAAAKGESWRPEDGTPTVSRHE